MADHSSTTVIDFVSLSDLSADQMLWLQSHHSNPVFGSFAWYESIINFECTTSNKIRSSFGFLIVEKNQTINIAAAVMKFRLGFRLVSNFYCPSQYLFYDPKIYTECNAWESLIESLSNSSDWSFFYLPTTSQKQYEAISTALNRTPHKMLAAEYKKNYVAHFDNFDQYWSSRPSILKNTVKRKIRKIGQEDVRFVIKSISCKKDIDDYWAVYGKSWKVPEPSNDFMNWLIEHHFEDTEVLLGFIYFKDQPIACQLWIISERVASIFKLAQDKKFDYLSPGTLLTYNMIKYSFERGVSTIDFLLGDDPFKDLWMDEYYQFYHVELINTRKLLGKIISYLKLTKQSISDAKKVLRRTCC